MTEAELQRLESVTDQILEQFQRGQKTDNGVVAQHVSDLRGFVRRLQSEIRSLRTQLSSPSEELVEAVAFDIFCAHSIPPKTGDDALARWAAEGNIGKLFFGAMARAALTAIAQKLGLEKTK